MWSWSEAMSSNSDTRKKQFRTLGLVLALVAIIAVVAAVLTKTDEKPTLTEAQRKEVEPRLTNIMTPGASIGDKDGWRAKEGAEVSALKEEMNRLKQQLEQKDRSEKADKDRLDRERQLGEIKRLDPQKGGAVEPRLVEQSQIKPLNLAKPNTNEYPTLGPKLQLGSSTPVPVTQVLGKPTPYPLGSPNSTPSSTALNAPTGNFTSPLPNSNGTNALPFQRQNQPESQTGVPASRIRRLESSEADTRSTDTFASGSKTFAPVSTTGAQLNTTLLNGGANTTDSTKFSEVKTTENYLPTGSFAEGYVLSGLDAPTGGQAQNNPVPVLITLSDNAILPMRMRSSIKECFVTGNGYGDITSERAYIRTEQLSCIKKDGTAIDIPIRGYVSGEDGKAGVRGPIVEKNGQIIGNAIRAGLLSGFGSAITAGSTTTTASVLGSTTIPNSGEAFQAGFGTSVSKSMDRLAQYYISLAEKTFPTVSVEARRKVTVVLTRGTFIDNRPVAASAVSAPTAR
jgi:conjugal transfer pilus assembly protein TraB